MPANCLGAITSHESDNQSADNWHDNGPEPKLRHCVGRRGRRQREAMEESQIGCKGNESKKTLSNKCGRHSDYHCHAAKLHDSGIDQRVLRRGLGALGDQVEAGGDCNTFGPRGMRDRVFRHYSSARTAGRWRIVSLSK